MPERDVPFGEEAFRKEKVQVKQYDRGVRDAGSDGAAAAREEHRDRLAYDDNEATAPGKVCGICGSVISAGQQARLRADDRWVHETCPIR
jgi:hypothetical protein